MGMRLELRTSPRRQVFATEKILEDEIVLDIHGPLRLKHEIPSPYTEDKHLQIGDYLYIELDDELTNAVNHSCDPNTAVIIDDVTPHVFLAAIRDIEPGEEVTYDYSATMLNDDWEAPCTCGSTICRGKIQEFKHLPEAVRTRYRALTIVPKYILDKTQGA